MAALFKALLLVKVNPCLSSQLIRCSFYWTLLQQGDWIAERVQGQVIICGSGQNRMRWKRCTGRLVKLQQQQRKQRRFSYSGIRGVEATGLDVDSWRRSTSHPRANQNWRSLLDEWLGWQGSEINSARSSCKQDGNMQMVCVNWKQVWNSGWNDARYSLVQWATVAKRLWAKKKLEIELVLMPRAERLPKSNLS